MTTPTQTPTTHYFLVGSQPVRVSYSMFNDTQANPITSIAVSNLNANANAEIYVNLNDMISAIGFSNTKRLIGKLSRQLLAHKQLVLQPSLSNIALRLCTVIPVMDALALVDEFTAHPTVAACKIRTAWLTTLHSKLLAIRAASTVESANTLPTLTAITVKTVSDNALRPVPLGSEANKAPIVRNPVVYKPREDRPTVPTVALPVHFVLDDTIDPILDTSKLTNRVAHLQTTFDNAIELSNRKRVRPYPVYLTTPLVVRITPTIDRYTSVNPELLSGLHYSVDQHMLVWLSVIDILRCCGFKAPEQRLKTLKDDYNPELGTEYNSVLNNLPVRLTTQPMRSLNNLGWYDIVAVRSDALPALFNYLRTALYASKVPRLKILNQISQVESDIALALDTMAYYDYTDLALTPSLVAPKH